MFPNWFCVCASTCTCTCTCTCCSSNHVLQFIGADVVSFSCVPFFASAASDIDALLAFLRDKSAKKMHSEKYKEKSAAASAAAAAALHRGGLNGSSSSGSSSSAAHQNGMLAVTAVGGNGAGVGTRPLRLNGKGGFHPAGAGKCSHNGSSSGGGDDYAYAMNGGLPGGAEYAHLQHQQQQHHHHNQMMHGYAEGPDGDMHMQAQ
jgi:hypothetical protein